MSIGIWALIFLALFMVEGLAEKVIEAWREKNKRINKSDDE